MNINLKPLVDAFAASGAGPSLPKPEFDDELNCAFSQSSLLESARLVTQRFGQISQLGIGPYERVYTDARSGLGFTSVHTQDGATETIGITLHGRTLLEGDYSFVDPAVDEVGDSGYKLYIADMPKLSEQLPALQNIVSKAALMVPAAKPLQRNQFQ